MLKLTALAAIIIALSSCGPRATSVPGIVGAAGPTGPAGSDGTGCTSQAVAPGAVLPNGGQVLTCSNGSFLVSNGSNGTNGATGSTGTNGATGSTGAAGATGATGVNGATGETGSTGTVGADGSPGTPGTIITAMQLCSPSFVPTYPSVFPEIALCINDVLFGVYSANGGFLSPLPPGAYSSDGINASCSFTIGADCAIQD